MSKPIPTAAEGVSKNDPRINELKDLEYDFHALVCMANISEYLLEDLFSDNTIVQKTDFSVSLQITTHDMDNAQFAYHDLTNKAEELKAKFMAALYPVEVQP